jgi:hypothetical protein
MGSTVPGGYCSLWVRVCFQQAYEDKHESAATGDTGSHEG